LFSALTRQARSRWIVSSLLVACLALGATVRDATGQGGAAASQVRAAWRSSTRRPTETSLATNHERSFGQIRFVVAVQGASKRRQCISRKGIQSAMDGAKAKEAAGNVGGVAGEYFAKCIKSFEVHPANRRVRSRPIHTASVAGPVGVSKFVGVAKPRMACHCISGWGVVSHAFATSAQLTGRPARSEAG